MLSSARHTKQRTRCVCMWQRLAGGALQRRKEKQNRSDGERKQCVIIIIAFSGSRKRASNAIVNNSINTYSLSTQTLATKPSTTTRMTSARHRHN